MAQLIVDTLPDELEASRRFANDVYALALWAETRRHSQPSRVTRLLSEASGLAARCRALVTSQEPSGSPAWRSFFTRLDAFVREIVSLSAAAQPSATSDHLQALDRLSDLIAENTDLVAAREHTAQGIARAWVEAIDDLREAFGIQGAIF